MVSAAEVGDVFAEGEFAVDVDIVSGDAGVDIRATSLSVRLALKRARSSASTSRARLPLASDLRPWSSKPWVISWPMTAPMPP